MAHRNRTGSEPKLSGNVIIGELLRNAEVGRFEMAYTVLLPCAFTVYLNPEDHAALSGVFDHVMEDAKRALRARVAELNTQQRTPFLRRKESEPAKEHKIACRDWSIEFFPEPEVPRGDVEIHSELNEIAQPGYRGTKTTLMEREPSATRKTAANPSVTGPEFESVYAELRYQDESGPRIYAISQNQVKVGRSGDNPAIDLPLCVSDEVSREHLTITRDAATGVFSITDCSTNGTWLNGKRLRKGIKEKLPAKAEINVGEVLTLQFEARR